MCVNLTVCKFKYFFLEVTESLPDRCWLPQGIHFVSRSKASLLINYNFDLIFISVPSTSSKAYAAQLVPPVF